MNDALLVNRLLRWAKWKFSSGGALGYPRQVSYIRLAPSTTYFRDPGMDADCQLTDDAYWSDLLPVVCRAVLEVEYLSTAISKDHKARVFGRTRRRYEECLVEAHTKIGNIINLLYSQKKERDERARAEKTA